MKDLSNTTLWEFLESIRERTRENILIIRNNKSSINDIEEQILNASADNPERILDLKKRNKELSEENYQLLELHKSILGLADRYDLYPDKDEDNSQDLVKTEHNRFESEYLSLIRNDEFNLDKHFYFLDDEETAEEIYNTLLQLERYEDCAKILKYSREKKDFSGQSFFQTLGSIFRSKKKNQ